MKKVLIVDDAAFMRSSLMLILKDTDYEIVGEAENGRVALKKINTLKPDIVLLDITMPEMDGLECLKEISKLENKPIVIMISAMAQKENVIKAISLGAKSFIVKPFNNEEVLSTINKL